MRGTFSILHRRMLTYRALGTELGIWLRAKPGPDQGRIPPHHLMSGTSIATQIHSIMSRAQLDLQHFPACPMSQASVY